MPVVFSKGFALTLMSQMGIMIIFALSLQHAAGAERHAVVRPRGLLGPRRILRDARDEGDRRRHALAWPISLLPLIGGLAGAFFGIVFGYLTTRKAGTPFAMITLGIGEMVFAASLMFPGFFGGEGGITGNRAVGRAASSASRR